MPSATAIFTVLAGIVAIAAAAVYFIGIPVEWKRKMEETALEKMGENKGSHLKLHVCPCSTDDADQPLRQPPTS